MPSPETRDETGRPAPAALVGLQRWAPGVHELLHYRRENLRHDLVAGTVLSAVLVPVGMGYAEASGLPAIHGLYATILPLLVYALFGPSRSMVVGPDSTLAAVIAALILPLAAGSVERAVALAGMLALLTAAFQLLLGLARLGIVADLFSKPVRLGFLNAIALTVGVGQLPRLLGLPAGGDTLSERIGAIVQTLAADGVANPSAAIGVGCLAPILSLRAWRPRWPGVLIAVAAVTVLSAAFDLQDSVGLAVLGEMPRGLPLPQWPLIQPQDLRTLVVGAAVIAMLGFADTMVLSRSLEVEARARGRVNPNQEMLALGAANAVTGLTQGFPVSASVSRTAVASAAGSRTQLTGIVGATLIALLLILAPGLLHDVPLAALAAAVMAACLSFADVRGMFALYRMRRPEFALALIAFLGVAFLGVVEGIGIAVLLSMLLLIWNAWHPYSTPLVRVDGRRGWHDATRHPEGRLEPGLLIYRWDAQLFFANAEVFRKRVLEAVERTPAPVRWVIVAADAISLIDITAAESLEELERELRERGIELHFAGLKGHVKDSLPRLGLSACLGLDRCWATVSSAVDVYRARQAAD